MGAKTGSLGAKKILDIIMFNNPAKAQGTQTDSISVMLKFHGGRED